MKRALSVVAIGLALARPVHVIAMVAGTLAVAGSALRAAEMPMLPSAPRAYEIASQELDAALADYIRASGAQVLYETGLTTGRRSKQVGGDFTPAAALAALLRGTGLSAHQTDIDTFVIVAASPAVAEPSAIFIRPHTHFMARLQAGVLAALCGSARTRPGEYRVAIELWIAPTGTVQRSALVGSTGDAERDKELLSVLSKASVQAMPPPGFPQPFIMSIGRKSPNETGDCVD